MTKKGIRIIIPTIVVNELLRDVDLERQNNLYIVLQQRFIVRPFCNKPALECARLAKMHDMAYPKTELKDSHSNTAIKADWMILATALVHNIEVLYTEDRGLHSIAKLVQDKIKVEYIPEPFREDIFE